MRRALDDARARGSGGPPVDPETERQKLVHNERTKLSATFLNGVALALLVTAGLTTIVGYGSLPSPNDQLVRALVWVVSGGLTHVAAILVLGNLL